jgi:hypothetical protein
MRRRTGVTVTSLPGQPPASTERSRDELDRPEAPLRRSRCELAYEGRRTEGAYEGRRTEGMGDENQAAVGQCSKVRRGSVSASS